MSYSNLISTNYLIKNTTIDNNVDPSLLINSIKQAQDINLQFSIGNALYYKLCSAIDAGSGQSTLTGKYLILLNDYIQPALAQWALYYALPFISFRLTNKSISEKKSDFSDPADLDDLKFLRQTVKNIAENYLERVKSFIQLHINDFPEYHQLGENGINVTKRTNYFSGLVLSDRYTNGRGYNDGCCD